MSLAATGARSAALDTLRGAAIVWMVGYHLAYDLDHFRFIDADFHRDPRWTLQRTAILSLFLFTAGAAQAIAVREGQTWRRFWWRWAQVALAAMLVSAGSWWMFPRSAIWFGVLHGIAAMLPIVRLASGAGAWLWLAGAVAIALPQLLASSAFNTPWLIWTGLATRKPVTEDFVPLLPWLGVMAWGAAAGAWLHARRSTWLAVPMPRGLAPLAAVGRRPLVVYLLHQPLMLGTLAGYVAWRGASGGVHP